MSFSSFFRLLRLKSLSPIWAFDTSRLPMIAFIDRGAYEYLEIHIRNQKSRTSKTEIPLKNEKSCKVLK